MFVFVFLFKDKMILAILSFIVMGVMLVAFSVLSQNTKMVGK